MYNQILTLIWISHILEQLLRAIRSWFFFYFEKKNVFIFGDNRRASLVFLLVYFLTKESIISLPSRLFASLVPFYDWKLVMHMVLKFKYNAKDFLHFNHLNSKLTYWKISINGTFPKMYISHVKIAWKIQSSWLCFILPKLVPESFDYGKTTGFVFISKRY